MGGGLGVGHEVGDLAGPGVGSTHGGRRAAEGVVAGGGDRNAVSGAEFCAAEVGDRLLGGGADQEVSVGVVGVAGQVAAAGFGGLDRGELSLFGPGVVGGGAGFDASGHLTVGVVGEVVGGGGAVGDVVGLADAVGLVGVGGGPGARVVVAGVEVVVLGDLARRVGVGGGLQVAHAVVGVRGLVRSCADEVRGVARVADAFAVAGEGVGQTTLGVVLEAL